MRAQSLVGPLILIGIGTIFLLRNMLPEFHIIEIFRDWWPALLILIGLAQLIDRLAKSNRVH